MGFRAYEPRALAYHLATPVALALGERSVEAEVTLRRARGVTRKPERRSVHKLLERFEAGGGPA